MTPYEARDQAREQRKEAAARGEVLPFYVVCYGITRHYGGPEEGGWYYDWLRIVEVRKCWSAKDGVRVVHELREEYANPNRNWDRFSVLGGEDYYVRPYANPDCFPEEDRERPHYE